LKTFDLISKSCKTVELFTAAILAQSAEQRERRSPSAFPFVAFMAPTNKNLSLFDGRSQLNVTHTHSIFTLVLLPLSTTVIAAFYTGRRQPMPAAWAGFI
jgi:hypothetical protein